MFLLPHINPKGNILHAVYVHFSHENSVNLSNVFQQGQNVFRIWARPEKEPLIYIDPNPPCLAVSGFHQSAKLSCLLVPFLKMSDSDKGKWPQENLKDLSYEYDHSIMRLPLYPECTGLTCEAFEQFPSIFWTRIFYAPLYVCRIRFSISVDFRQPLNKSSLSTFPVCKDSHSAHPPIFHSRSEVVLNLIC